MKGVLAGAVGLLVLHALVARANQSQLTGLTNVAVGFVERFLNPAIPAIPDHNAKPTPAPVPQVPVSTLKIAPVPVPNLWNSTVAASPTNR